MSASDQGGYSVGGRLNRMDNLSFEREGERRAVVEMGDVPPLTTNGGVLGCTDHCLSLHQQHMQSYRQQPLQQHQQATKKPTAESPWHRLKTVFLVGTIAILVLWVAVYTTLSQLKML